MKKITIEVPDGKKAVQSEKDGILTIMFTSKPKHWSEMDSFEEFYEAADDAARKEYDDDLCISPDAVAYKMLRLIIRVTNTDPETGIRWIPNWSDTHEKKWWPWFNLSSGCGFVDSGYGYDGTITGVGSRLCFQTKEKSDGIAKKFIKIYEAYITIKN